MVSVSSFCEFLDNIPAIEATHFDIRDYMAFVAQRGVKRATLHRLMDALRCFFDFLNMGGLSIGFSRASSACDELSAVPHAFSVRSRYEHFYLPPRTFKNEP